MTQPDPEGPAPLSPAEYQVLLALADGDKHGYAIMQEVDRMGPGTLYGAIKRLLKAGFIAEADARPAPEADDQRRKYYRMTDLGRRVAVAETERLGALVQTALSKKLKLGVLRFDLLRG